MNFSEVCEKCAMMDIKRLKSFKRFRLEVAAMVQTKNSAALSLARAGGYCFVAALENG